MTRQSPDLLAPDGTLWDGYDYVAQCWVRDGLVQGCTHPAWMRNSGFACCTSYQYAGFRIIDVPNHEVRKEK
jgi:hypothetical protein